jgi:hypothetical protein
MKHSLRAVASIVSQPDTSAKSQPRPRKNEVPVQKARGNGYFMMSKPSLVEEKFISVL